MLREIYEKFIFLFFSHITLKLSALKSVRKEAPDCTVRASEQPGGLKDSDLIS